MHPSEIEQFELMLKQENRIHLFWEDFSILPVIGLIIVSLIVIVIASRLILRAIPGLTGETCRVCGGTLKRIHHARWLKVISPLLPLRTMYCRACSIKSIRVKAPRKKPKRRRRSKKASSVTISRS
jgi:hypothetical protein